MRDEPLTPEQIKEWEEFEDSLPTLEEMRAEFIDSLQNNMPELVADKIKLVEQNIAYLKRVTAGELFPNTPVNEPIQQIAIASQIQAWAQLAGLYHEITRRLNQPILKSKIISE